MWRMEKALKEHHKKHRLLVASFCSSPVKSFFQVIVFTFKTPCFNKSVLLKIFLKKRKIIIKLLNT